MKNISRIIISIISISLVSKIASANNLLVANVESSSQMSLLIAMLVVSLVFVVLFVHFFKSKQSTIEELKNQKMICSTQADKLLEVNEKVKYLSIVAEKTDNAIMIMDKTGEFEWINPAFTKIFGYTFNQLVEEKSTNIVGGDTSPHFKKLFEDCLSSKESVSYEYPTKNRAGEPIYVNTTLTPVLDQNGEIEKIIAIDSDISKLKEKE